MLVSIVLPIAIACVAYVVSGVVSSKAICCFKSDVSRIVFCMILFIVFVAVVCLSLRFPATYEGKFYFSDIISFLPISFY